MEQEELLQKIAQILDKLSVPYIVTGGIATVVWGRPRFTADIDIVIELLPEKIDILAHELLAIDKDVYVDKEMMVWALLHKKEFNFLHPTSGLKVDFWILKDNEFDRERIKRRVRKEVAGTPMYFISPEDLIPDFFRNPFVAKF